MSWKLWMIIIRVSCWNGVRKMAKLLFISFWYGISLKSGIVLKL